MDITLAHATARENSPGTSDNDLSTSLQSKVLACMENRSPIQIVGGNSKAFYGRAPQGEHLSVLEHRGIVDYEPTELVITARAGTRLIDMEKVLAERGQMLAFEPPHFANLAQPGIASTATFGGAIATGLSGPCRPYAGSARDFVLGAKVLTGKGEILKFGGQVMKNVAGFDVARLMTGSLGTLGILLEISLKVLPRHEAEQTLVFACDVQEAIQRMNTCAGQPIPLSGTTFDRGKLYVRLSGSTAAVRTAQTKLGGELSVAGADFWRSMRDHTAQFFQDSSPLWRISMPAAGAPLGLEGAWLLEWGGAQRWLKTWLPGNIIREQVARAGGHATLFSGGDRHSDIFHPLTPALTTLHQRLKIAFDPHGILNPGRMFANY
ncbi:MAG: glycolate oxidase subunit GlcE [Candidatus Nitrotoga sp.]